MNDECRLPKLDAGFGKGSAEIQAKSTLHSSAAFGFSQRQRNSGGLPTLISGRTT
jgi:hypothetical protein